MKCVVCKKGDTHPGTTTVTLERGTTTIVFKGVPADICQNCGEAYVAKVTTDRLLETLAAAEEARVQIDVRQFEPPMVSSA